MPTFLNKQVIAMLSSLGVPDKVFLDIQKRDLGVLEHSLHENSSALATLVRCGVHPREIEKEESDEYELLASGSLPLQAIADTLYDGYNIENDPFFKSVLSSIRQALLAGFRKKARYFVKNAATLIGILDETGELEPNEICINLESQYHNGKNKYPNLTGKQVIVGRNPCLHPGDIRRFTVAFCARLTHLKNCIIFSQNGDYPQPHSMSGGDLDGDAYFVIWDKDLMTKWNISLMIDHTKAAVPDSSKNLSSDGVSADDEARFFVDFIKNDRLGAIANSHLVHYDMNSRGVFCKACQELANLHSKAVDFNKTGVPVFIPHRLRVQKFPDYLGKEKNRSYKSDKILGKLYRIVKKQGSFGYVKHGSNDRYIGEGLKIDESFLFEGFERFSVDALNLFKGYQDNIHSIMQCFDIWDEGELISGRISRSSWKTTGTGWDNSAREQLNYTMKKLRRDTVSWFWSIVGPNKDDYSFREKYHRCLQLSSAIYYSAYTSNSGISCPWIFHQFLLQGRAFNLRNDTASFASDVSCGFKSPNETCSLTSSVSHSTGSCELY